MRSDMSKVVTEAPRYGSGNRSKKTGLRIRSYDPDQEYDFPTRLPSSRHRQYGWGGKEFSDVLGPLKRFLRSRVGRNWNRVYSELSQHLDKRSLSGLHIWTHVWIYVEKDCVIGSDRKIYRMRGFDGRLLEVSRQFYVHPATNILSWVD